MSETAPKVAFPLRLKLQLFGAALAILPTVAVGFGLMEINATTLESQNRELRLAVAEEITTTLETTLKQGQLGLLRVQQVITNRSLSDDTRIELATAMVEADPILDTVAIYGRQGDYVAQIDQSDQRFPEDPLPPEVAKRASAEGVVLTPIGNTIVEIVMPIRPTVDQVTGFTRTRVGLKDPQAHTMAIARGRLSPGSRIDVVTTR